MAQHRNKALAHANSKLGLLVFGFILTSVFGSLITYFSQYLSWQRDKCFETIKWERDKQYEIFKYKLEQAMKGLEEGETTLQSKVTFMRKLFDASDNTFVVKGKWNKGEEEELTLDNAKTNLETLKTEYAKIARNYDINYLKYRLALENHTRQEFANGFFDFSKRVNDACLHAKIRKAHNRLLPIIDTLIKNLEEVQEGDDKGKKIGDAINSLRGTFNDMTKGNLPEATRRFIIDSHEKLRISIDSNLSFGGAQSKCGVFDFKTLHNDD